MSLIKKIAIGTIAAILAGGGFWAFRAIRVAQNMKFAFGLPKNIKFSGGFVFFDLPIFITNPINYSLKVNWLQLELGALNSYLGTANIESDFEILPLRRTEIVAAFQIESYQLLNIVPRALNGVITVQYSGFVGVLGVPIPIDEESTLNISNLTKRA